MINNLENQFSETTKVFLNKILPEEAILAGYSALTKVFALKAPLPNKLCAIGKHHKIYEKDDWVIMTPRHLPEPTILGHLTFALKYEGLDLIVLKRLFQAIESNVIEEIVSSSPTGIYSRKIWFLYEWLLGEKINVPDATMGSYVCVVDTEKQYGGKEELSIRHRVKNNLTGTPLFCPLVFRTKKLDEFKKLNLSAKAQEVIDVIPKDIMARASAFLLLKDSKSSYAIEGERPPQDRIQRWGRIIGEAGQKALTLEELFRLQNIVIGDARFVNLGLRKDGGFVGEHDRDSGSPIPEHISARPEDLESLIEGLISFDRDFAPFLDPVISSAMIAFGFVYIHPFEDGNGRLHRYLIHHELAKGGFNPQGVVFPISSAIFENIIGYRNVLQGYSGKLIDFIEWEATEKGNVKVLNETADFYRYFDATYHAEFLYDCVLKTIETDLPYETDFLKKHDLFIQAVQDVVDMPDKTLNLLFRMLQKGGGNFSKRAKTKEFADLKEDEIIAIEKKYNDIFEN